METKDRALNALEFSRMIGVSIVTAYQILRSGRISAVQVGKRGQWRMAKSEVERFLRGDGVEVHGTEAKAA